MLMKLTPGFRFKPIFVNDIAMPRNVARLKTSPSKNFLCRISFVLVIMIIISFAFIIMKVALIIVILEKVPLYIENMHN